MNKILNQYQRNAITVTLREFEANLRKTLEWLDGKQVDGILYREAFQVSDDKRDEIRREALAALEEIEGLARELALESVSQDTGRVIRAEMAVAWSNLLDTQSKKLRGYGDVHPKLAERLDPSILKLSKIALRLANHNEDAEASGENHEHD